MKANLGCTYLLLLMLCNDKSLEALDQFAVIRERQVFLFNYEFELLLIIALSLNSSSSINEPNLNLNKI